jgi:hypothetical protein
MNGVQTEYLLGLYFIVTSLSTKDRLSVDAVKLIAGVVFLVMAIFNFSLLGMR